MNINAPKERYLVNRKLIELARKNGEVFGGSIPTIFRRKHYVSKYKKTLIKNDDMKHFDRYYNYATYDSESYKYRTERIRDIDVFFKYQEDVENFKKDIYKIAGVFNIQECNAHNYKKHVLFDKNYNLEKIIVKYTMNHSFCEPGYNMSFQIDIVTPSIHCEIYENPIHMMQELTIKQLTWNVDGIHSSLHVEKSHQLEKCFDIIHDFISDICYIKEETGYMRDKMREYLQSYYDDVDGDNISMKEKLSRCLETRIMVIMRILRYHMNYTIVNSPMSFEKDSDKDCGICFNTKKQMFKWRTQQNNTQLYCFECIYKYLQTLKNIDDTVLYTHDFDEDHFHNNPILTSEEWRHLNLNQIYLIENILVCPVGNKANFSCIDNRYLSSE